MAKISDNHLVRDIMKDGLVNAFESLILQSDLKEAMRIISVIEIPPPSVVNDIIFNILMKNCDEKVANEANAYLNNYLICLPTKSPTKSLLTKEAFQYDYKAVLEDKSGIFSDIWSVFFHLVESSFIHHNISTENEISSTFEVVKLPNCDILIDFYAQMLIKFLSLENDLFEDDSEERFSILLQWINKIYKLTDQRIIILDVLHMLLDDKVKYDLTNTAPRKVYALSNLILNKCRDIFSSVEKMKGFNARSNLSLVLTMIYQHKLYELIYKKKLPKKGQFPLTLKIIVQNYLFYPILEGENKTESPKSPVLKIKLVYQPGQNNHHWVCANEVLTDCAIGTPMRPLKKTKIATISKGKLKKIFSKDETEGDSELHKLCRANRCGDLTEIILSNSDLEPNKRNSAERTPLHEACLCKSYYCAKFLLEDVQWNRVKLDLKAADRNGLTPLHCAAYVDSVEIARMLLKHGGAHLVSLKDNFGEQAIKYANSESMKKLLTDFESKVQESTSEESSLNFNKDYLVVPTMKDKEEYSIFLFGLHTILKCHLEKSNLHDYIEDKVDKLSHEHRKCLHYVSLTKNRTAVCDDDASSFKSLPQFLDHFLACVQSDAKKIDVNIRINLLPLVLLRNMLDDNKA